MLHPHEQTMRRAIAIAKEHYTEGGHAVAAIIVKGEKIIAEAFTTVRRDTDPTAHAEMNAIREAAKHLGTKLIDCYLYTTYEPCPMCTSAAIWAKMKGIVYGAGMSDQTETHPQRIAIPASDIIAHGTPKLELYPGYMRDECTFLLALDPKK